MEEKERKLPLPNNLRRTPRDKDEEIPDNGHSVSDGAVNKVIDLAFNPTREKIREVTIIDRMQGRLFPLLDLINAGQQYVLEVATYRQDPVMYAKLFKKPAPVSPNLLDEFMYRTAQWQKSVQGKNLERATDIALAETEGKSGEGDIFGGNDPWKDD